MKQVCCIVILLAAGLLIFGCSSLRGFFMSGKSSIQVLEKVHHEGWKVCGTVIVSENRSYQWTRKDIWNAGVGDVVFSGTLPEKLFQGLMTSSRSGIWAEVQGVPTYEYAVDDTKTAYPAPVINLFAFLHEQHNSLPASR